MDKSKTATTIIDVWRLFPIIQNFLIKSEKINFQLSCKLVKQLTDNSVNWPYLELTNQIDNELPERKLKWIWTSLKKHHVKEFTISIFEISDDLKGKLMNMLLEGVIESLEKLDIYCESDDIHLACSLCFPNLKELTIRSRCASNELMEYMSKNIINLHSLTVIKNDLQFTCKNLSKFITNPMEKLVIKPYSIDFDEICQITERSAETMKELEIDVEEASPALVSVILKPLKKLNKLRLFHLEYFNEDCELWECLSKQPIIHELVITKTYNMKLDRILSSVSTHYLQILDITDSKFTSDHDLILMASKCPNLIEVNLSWCNCLTSMGLSFLIANCLNIEVLILTGIKEANDEIFGQIYNELLTDFQEENFTKARNDFLSKLEQGEQGEEKPKMPQIGDFFKSEPNVSSINILKNLKLIECQSCNRISDNILKIICLINPEAKAFDYYGNSKGLFDRESW